MENKPPFSILDYEEFYKEYELAQRLKDKKLKSLSKPIEPPRRIYDQREEYLARARKKGRRSSHKESVEEDDDDEYSLEMLERE